MSIINASDATGQTKDCIGIAFVMTEKKKRRTKPPP